MTGLLEELASRYGTDKCSGRHDYTKYYDDIFSSRRLTVQKVLEIGVYNGASLKMWKDYFPNAVIYGLDINPDCRRCIEERIRIVISDQTDTACIPVLMEDEQFFDFIIDDGSHRSKHQIASFEMLFPYVKERGSYIVEDVCCSYWSSYQEADGDPATCIEYFKRKVDEINFHGLRGDAVDRNKAYLRSILRQQGQEPTFHQRAIRKIAFYNSTIEIERDEE